MRQRRAVFSRQKIYPARRGPTRAVTTAIVLLLAASAVPVLADDAADGIVTLCHRPDDGGTTIHVNASAVDAHLRHGDTLGACADAGEDPGGNDTDGNDTDGNDTDGNDTDGDRGGNGTEGPMTSGNETTQTATGLAAGATVFSFSNGTASTVHLRSITIFSSTGHDGNVTVIARPLSGLPDGAAAVPGGRAPIQVWDITLETDNGSSPAFGHAILVFEVNTTWLAERCDARCTVQVVHWDGSRWETLVIHVTRGEQTTSIHAGTTSFSPFALGGLFSGGGGPPLVPDRAEAPVLPIIPVVPVGGTPGDGATDGGTTPGTGGPGAPAEGGTGDGSGPPMGRPDVWTPIIPWVLALLVALFVAVLSRRGHGVGARRSAADRALQIDQALRRPWEARHEATRKDHFTPVGAAVHLLHMGESRNETMPQARLDALRIVIAHEGRRMDRMFRDLRQDVQTDERLAVLQADVLPAAVVDEAYLLNRLFAAYRQARVEERTRHHPVLAEPIELWVHGTDDVGALAEEARRFDRAVRSLQDNDRLGLPEAPLLRAVATEEARDLARRFASRHALLVADAAQQERRDSGA